MTHKDWGNVAILNDLWYNVAILNDLWYNVINSTNDNFIGVLIR